MFCWLDKDNFLYWFCDHFSNQFWSKKFTNIPTKTSENGTCFCLVHSKVKVINLWQLSRVFQYHINTSRSPEERSNLVMGTYSVLHILYLSGLLKNLFLLYLERPAHFRRRWTLSRFEVSAVVKGELEINREKEILKNPKDNVSWLTRSRNG